MARYLFRAKPETEEMFRQRTNNVKAMVAIQVRRTDKKTEAFYQPIEAYMKHVEEYFEKIEIENETKLEEKRVYVASDDPNILDECKQKFPGFFFINELLFFSKEIKQFFFKHGYSFWERA